jgi:hypothetical protein
MQGELQCQNTFDISTFIYNTLNKPHHHSGGGRGFPYNLRV